MKKLILFFFCMIVKFGFSQTWYDVWCEKKIPVQQVFLGPSNSIATYGIDVCDTGGGPMQKWMIKKTKNKGDTWEEIISGCVNNQKPHFEIFGMHFFDSLNAIGYGDRLYRTNDGWKTWVKVLPNDTNVFGGFFLRLNATSVLFFSDKIYKIDIANSIYKVVSDSLVSNFVNGFFNNTAVKKGGNIYVLSPQKGLNRLNIMKSTDDGEHWSVIKTSINIVSRLGSNYCISMLTENEGLVATTAIISTQTIDYVFRFKNDSIYYNDTIIIDKNPWNGRLRIIGMHFYNNCEGVIATGEPYHYKTIDGGATWSKTEVSVGYGYKYSFYFDSVCVLFGANYDFANEVRHLNISYNRAGPPYPNATNTTCIINTTGISNEESSSKIRVSPNPFKNQIQILLNEDNQDAEIALFDNTGKLILTKSTNQKEEVIITDKLSPGVYILSVSTYSGKQNFKVIKF